MQHLEWKIKKMNDGQSVRDFLKKENFFSRRILKSVIYDGGAIILNKHRVKLTEILSENDVLVVKFPEEEKGPRMKPEDIPLDIVYEDDYILIVNKPAHMATIPSYHYPSGTLANAILAYYKVNHIPFTVHVVTRLDRGTSGLVLIAKNRYSHSLLSAVQKNGELKRHYQAIVTGVLSPEKGIINKNIGRKDGSVIERTIRDDGKPAITHYKTLKQTSTHTLVNVELKTGRTHQIRVHFSALGYPLVGDDLYGGTKDVIDRQALHCCHIKLTHPFTNKIMDFYSSLPDDMKRIVD